MNGAAFLAPAVWAAVPCVPLLLAGLLLIPAARRAALALAPWAALPAFALAALTPRGSAAALPGMLLGSSFTLDGTALVFLLLTAALWTAAGLYARAYLAGDPARRRYFLFHLLTLSGNLGLTLAADVVSFYLFFALMTFAAYGLVVHTGSAAARRAGRVYIGMAVVGEGLILAGVLLAVEATLSLDFTSVAASVADSPRRDLIVALVLAGFGIKAGAVPLHLWLPLAHPVAPTPASAVLSGAMIKAGLLAWLRLLPVGTVALPGWTTVLLLAGGGGAVLAALVGALQDDAKTVLAYSSVSQMGWMTAGVGVALGAPEHAAPAIAAVVLFAAHHGVAKAALFLGVGVSAAAPRRGPGRLLARVGLLLPAAALAGVPLTAGALAKARLKEAGAALPWPGWVEPLLAAAAVGTVLVLTRFLMLAWHGPAGHAGGGPGSRPPEPQPPSPHGAAPYAPASAGSAAGPAPAPAPAVPPAPRPSSPHESAPGAPPPPGPSGPGLLLWLPFILLAGLSALLAPGVGPATGEAYPWVPASPAAALTDLWPLAAGAVLAWGTLRARVRRRLPRVPPGDLLALAGLPAQATARTVQRLALTSERAARRTTSRVAARAQGLWRGAPLERAEDALEPWLVIGALFLFLAALLFLRLTVL